MKTRPFLLGIRKKLKELLEDLQKRKIIEKSSSEWAFPIVLVEKKDGSLRMCVDYRELNKNKNKAGFISLTDFGCNLAEYGWKKLLFNVRSV